MTLRRRLLKLLVLLALLAALYPLWHLGLALRLQTHNPEHSAYMSRAEAQGKVRHEWRDYEQISDYLKRAVLISEDAQFTRHGGCPILNVCQPAVRKPPRDRDVLYRGNDSLA